MKSTRLLLSVAALSTGLIFSGETRAEDELLRVAPWIMLRGNHEDCNRAGTGWFFFMSPWFGDRPKRGCSSTSDPYYIRWNDIVMGVLDSAHTGDKNVKYAYLDDKNDKLMSESNEKGKPNPFWRIAEVVDRIENSGARNVWLLTHHPLWLLDDSRKELAPLIAPKSPNDPRAFIAARSEGIHLVLSGDTHAFEAVIPAAESQKWPAQLVVGTGGTSLEKHGFPGPESPVTPETPVKRDVPEQPELTIWSSLTFGFVMLTRSADEWHAAFYDSVGNKKFDCTVIAKERRCEQL